jgi:hypothetical protein
LSLTRRRNPASRSPRPSIHSQSQSQCERRRRCLFRRGLFLLTEYSVSRGCFVSEESPTVCLVLVLLRGSGAWMCARGNPDSRRQLFDRESADDCSCAGRRLAVLRLRLDALRGNLRLRRNGVNCGRQRHRIPSTTSLLPRTLIALRSEHRSSLHANADAGTRTGLDTVTDPGVDGDL